jgi:hypothetical protein
MEIISIDLNDISNGRQLKSLFYQNGFQFCLKPKIVFTQYKNKGVNVLFCEKQSLTILAYFDKKWDFILDEGFEHFALNAKSLRFNWSAGRPKTKSIDINNLSLPHILNKIDKSGISLPG